MNRWIALLIAFFSPFLFFAGCGGGDESISQVLDVRNPEIVKNVAAISAHRRIRLVWSKEENESVIGYNIYRSSAATGGFAKIGSVGQSSAPFYQDEGPDTDKDGLPDGLTNNVTLFYKITAFDRAAKETPVDLSPSIAATPGQLPNETIDLSVENVRTYASRRQAFVSWDRTSSDKIYGYAVYRSITGLSSGAILVAITPKDVQGYTEGGLSLSESYTFSVAPVVNEIEDISKRTTKSGLLEGRRTESRNIKSLDGDGTTPKAPGSASGAPFSVTAINKTINNRNGVLLQWTRPTSNTDGSIIADNDDLSKGAYLIYRSTSLRSQYSLIGVLENIGSAAVTEFFDPYGTDSHFYYIKAGDDTGSISDSSDIASVKALVPPPTVKTLKALSGRGFGTVDLEWKPVTERKVDGYNVYRSNKAESGYIALAFNVRDQDADPSLVSYTDSSLALALGQTYYYKISATANSLESSLSSASAGSPGPTSGIIVIEAENAVKIDRSRLGSAAAQYAPQHYRSGANLNGNLTVFRQGLNAPFSGFGALVVQPQNAAGTDVAAGERLDLLWRVDVKSLIGDAGGGNIGADVYIVTADDGTTGEYQIFIDDKEIDPTRPPGTEPPPLNDTGFDGITAQINFRSTKFSLPLQPTRRLIGRLQFNHLLDYTSPISGNNVAGQETLYMSILHKGPQGVTSGFGDLKLDAIILVVR